MRAILDTNIIVSAAIKVEGKPAQIIRRATSEFDWFTSEYILAEVERALVRPHIQKRYSKLVPAVLVQEFIALMRERAEVVETIRTIDPTSRDPNDDPILASASDGHADYIVTGDRDLLALGEFEGITIVTPEQFLRILDNALNE